MGERLDRANVWLDRVMPVVAGIALPVGMFTWACTLPEHRAVRWGTCAFVVAGFIWIPRLPKLVQAFFEWRNR
jgi:hypothetical protein